MRKLIPLTTAVKIPCTIYFRGNDPINDFKVTLRSIEAERNCSGRNKISYSSLDSTQLETGYIDISDWKTEISEQKEIP